MCTHTHTYTRAHHHPRSPHVHPTPLHAHVHTHTHVCNHILPDNQEQRSACKPTSLHTQKRATPPVHNRTYTHAAMLPHPCTLTSVHVHQHAPCTPSYLQAHPCTDTHALPQPFAHARGATNKAPRRTGACLLPPSKRCMNTLHMLRVYALRAPHAMPQGASSLYLANIFVISPFSSKLA